MIRMRYSTSRLNAMALVIAMSCFFTKAIAQTTVHFSYTGSQQTWVVPAGVTSINVDMAGGSSGGQQPGHGGRVQATLTVTPGDILYVYVGQKGTAGASGGAAGWNGGGHGGFYSGSFYGAGGGGASDIRDGGNALSNRILVAGGGGGNNYALSSSGGAGGDVTGASPGSITDNPAPGGGTQVSGGTGGGTGGSSVAANGALGVGGDGAASSTGGGGGGGGYYGGGGGYNDGGGGGSSYTDPVLVTSFTHTQGYESGDGYVILSYTPAPLFTVLPTGSSVCIGAAVSTLTATVTGATSYQWYLNNTSTPNNFSAIGGATSNTYNIASIAYTDTGLYYLAATNTTGTTYSDTVEVSITPATVLTGSPASPAHVCFNGTQTITGTATGAGLSYQWAANTGLGYNPILDNSIYAGSTTGSLHISNPTTAMSGLYQLTITGTCGTVSTTPTTLIVDTTIISTPSTIHICSGNGSVLNGSGTGYGLLSYKWRVNTGSGFNDITDNFLYSGFTTNSLHINNTITAMSGYLYQLVVTDTCGAASSSSTTLTVDSTIITSNPPSTIHVCFGNNSTTISGAATSTGPLAYQWAVNTGSGYTALNNNGIYSGVTTNTLQISNAIHAMTGYTYKLYVSGCGIDSTTASTLFVDSTIITSNLPANTHFCYGGAPSMSVTATGPGLSYQWAINTGSGFHPLQDTGAYTGSATSTLHVANPNWSYVGFQYQVIITGTCNTDTSVATTIVVDSFPTQPYFLVHPTDVCQGQVNVVYTVNTQPDVSYNWSYSGGTGATITPVPNATANYTFSTTATDGAVSMYVSSLYGCGTSPIIYQGVNVHQYDIWTGAISTDWNTAGNWDRNLVPYATISAHIPSPTTNRAEVGAVSTFSVNNLLVDQFANLNIDTLSKLQVGGMGYLYNSITGPGILSFNGAAAQTITASDTVYNLEINNSHGVTLPVNSRIHIKTKLYPTLGTFTNNGTLFLISDSTGTATVGTGSAAGGYIVGNVNIQQYIHGGRRAYRFLAQPFSTSISIEQLASAFDITGTTGAAGGFTTTGTNNPSAFWYNPVTASGSETNDSTGWIPYTSVTDTGVNSWNPMEGLRIVVRGRPGEGLLGQTYTPSPTTINMVGPLAQGDKTIALTSNANKGYNFIGNPYAAPIDLSLLTLGSSVGPNFWVWDPNQGLQGAYISQPLAVPYTLSAYSSFVLTTTAATNNTVTFHESGKGFKDSSELFKTTGGTMGNNVLQLHILSNNNTLSWDRLLLYFNDNASANADALDAPKWVNDDLNFYTWSADNKEQSIDVRPYVDGQVIKLGLNATVQQTYSMNVDNLNVDANVKLYLHDKYLNKVQQLNQGDTYSFTVSSDVNSQGDNRFELNQVGQASGIVNVNAVSKLNVTIAPNPAAEVAVLTYAAAVQGTTSLQITNVIGQKVYTQELGEQKAGSIAIPVADMTLGIYLITLKCGEEVITKRFVKQ